MEPREAELERELALREAADAAYAEARRLVFDTEAPGADPAARTPEQQAVVAALEQAEQDLRECRRQLFGE